MFIFDADIILEAQGGEFPAPPLDTAFSWQSAEVGFRLKELLKLAGWVHQASGDGDALFSTTPGNVNDVITTRQGGPNGMNNSGAWFVLKHPGSARQLLFQIETAGEQYWRVGYSIGAGFTTGAPSATQTPDATDMQFPLGGGTGATPFSEPWLGNQPPDGVICQIAADNAAPYGFWVAGYTVNNDGSSPRFGGVFDPLTDTWSGDDDPFAFYFSNQSNTAFADELYWNGNSMRAHFGHGGPNEAWVSFVTPGNQPSISGSPFNFANNRVDQMPLFYMRHDSLALPTGWKGRSTLMRWVKPPFQNGQPLQRVTPRDSIVVGRVALPWNGTVPRI